MKHIEQLDAAMGTNITFEELGVQRTFFWAYKYSIEAETRFLDFNDVIWEQDIPGIIDSCRRFEIKRFTISCPMSSMAEIIWAFRKQGCNLVGMREVNTRFCNCAGERDRKPAFVVELPV